jgi:hypothetical protein
VFSARNAEFQVRAMMIGGPIAALSPGETTLAGQINTKTTGLTRSWEYWSMRVAKSGGLAGGIPGAAKKAKAVRSAAKSRRKSNAKRR